MGATRSLRLESELVFLLKPSQEAFVKRQRPLALFGHAIGDVKRSQMGARGMDLCKGFCVLVLNVFLTDVSDHR